MTEVKTIKCEIHCQNGESIHAAFPAVPGIWEREEIYVEVEEAVEDLYDTPEGQEYKKLLVEKQQGREEDYQQGMEHLLEQLTAEYHKSTGY